jgi:hypothetical protein
LSAGGASAGSTVSETVLYSFCNTKTANGVCLDGNDPTGDLIAVGPGTLYGTTESGGTANAGTVYC